MLLSVTVVLGPERDRVGRWSGVDSLDAGTGGRAGQNWGCERFSKMAPCDTEDCAELDRSKLGWGWGLCGSASNGWRGMGLVES